MLERKYRRKKKEKIDWKEKESQEKRSEKKAKKKKKSKQQLQNDGSERQRDLQIKPEDAGSHLSVCLDETGIGN